MVSTLDRRKYNNDKPCTSVSIPGEGHNIDEYRNSMVDGKQIDPPQAIAAIRHRHKRQLAV